MISFEMNQLWALGFRVTAVVAAMLCISAMRIDVEHQTSAQVVSKALLKDVPPVSGNDAATTAIFAVVDGVVGGEAGSIAKLHDGKLPNNSDEPKNNFFFAIDTLEGRFKIEFPAAIRIGRITTYSWHKDVRASQLYKVYGSDGAPDNFDPNPKIGTDPVSCGWTRIASVDTRPVKGPMGGMDVANIRETDASKPLGTYRYLLFVCFVTEVQDGWGHTFFSEVDVTEWKAK